MGARPLGGSETARKTRGRLQTSEAATHETVHYFVYRNTSKGNFLVFRPRDGQRKVGGRRGRAVTFLRGAAKLWLSGRLTGQKQGRAHAGQEIGRMTAENLVGGG